MQAATEEPERDRAELQDTMAGAMVTATIANQIADLAWRQRKRRSDWVREAIKEKLAREGTAAVGGQGA